MIFLINCYIFCFHKILLYLFYLFKFFFRFFDEFQCVCVYILFPVFNGIFILDIFQIFSRFLILQILLYLLKIFVVIKAKLFVNVMRSLFKKIFSKTYFRIKNFVDYFNRIVSFEVLYCILLQFYVHLSSLSSANVINCYLRRFFECSNTKK